MNERFTQVLLARQDVSLWWRNDCSRSQQTSSTPHALREVLTNMNERMDEYVRLFPVTQTTSHI